MHGQITSLQEAYELVAKGIGVRGKYIPEFETWLHSGLQVNYLISLHFRFLTYKMRISDTIYCLEAL